MLSEKYGNKASFDYLSSNEGKKKPWREHKTPLPVNEKRVVRKKRRKRRIAG
jgi:hypothetical protein